MTTLTLERETEIARLSAEMWRQRMREAGLDSSLTEEGYERLNEEQKKQVEQIGGACVAHEIRLRESGGRAPSTTRTLVNAGLIDLGAEGVPMVGAPALGPQADLDAPALMQALGEDGVTLTERSVGRPREGLNMKLREGQTPEEDSDRETVPTRRTVSTGGPEATRQDCPDCDTGLLDDGSRCPTCKGTGVLVKRPDGTLAAASAEQKLAESAGSLRERSAAALKDAPQRTREISQGLVALAEGQQVHQQRLREAEQLIDESPIPVSVIDGDVIAAGEAAREFIEAERQTDAATRSDGTLGLDGVPMVDDAGEAATELAEGNLIDLTDEPGVPNVTVPTRSAEDLLAEAEVAA